MMEDDLLVHVENALDIFTKDENVNELLAAREIYYDLAGEVKDSDDNYEERMKCFNDWYVFDYNRNEKNQKVIDLYIENESLDEEIAQTLKSVHHSVFEFLDTNFRKQYVIKDLVDGKKYVLPKEHSRPALLKNDYFVGRLLVNNKISYLLNGLCIIPKDAQSIIKKEIKRINKMKSSDQTMKFLLKIERLKSKWERYGRIESSKIFLFDKVL